jgi:hypothetical protein
VPPRCNVPCDLQKECKTIFTVTRPFYSWNAWQEVMQPQAWPAESILQGERRLA